MIPLTPTHPFFITSGGVIDFLCSQAVVDMIIKFKYPHDAFAEIVAIQAWPCLDSSKFIYSKV